MSIIGDGFTTDGSTEVYSAGARQWLVAPVSSNMLIECVLGNAALSGTVSGRHRRARSTALSR